MKNTKFLIATIAITLAGTVAYSATPGSILTASGQVNGTVAVTSTTPGGCPIRVCTTNEVTFSRCFTNWEFMRVCVTNAAGLIECTNVVVPVVRCFTNTFPEITCTNEFPAPTSLSVQELLSGDLSAIAGCDEFFSLFPSNATFVANLRLSVRTNDWVGTETGSFRILSDTNLLAFGSLVGVTGLGAPVAGGPCAVCNHFEGSLFGAVLHAGPVPGARIQAVYAGDVTGATCPSADVPQGAASLLINGVATIPCFSPFGGFSESFPVSPAQPVLAPAAQ
jgi:hypothetical protein